MGMVSVIKGGVAAVILGLSTLAAEAATFKLSYTYHPGQYPSTSPFSGLPDKQLTALIDGTLQSDGNTIFVSGVRDLRIDGILSPLTYGVLNFYDKFTNPNAAGNAKLSLNGLNNDLYWSNAALDRGIVFDSARQGPQANQQVWASLDLLGGYAPQSSQLGYYKESLAANRYSLTAVPLPAGGLLLVSGLGLFALRRKRA